MRELCVGPPQGRKEQGEREGGREGELGDLIEDSIRERED